MGGRVGSSTPGRGLNRSERPLAEKKSGIGERVGRSGTLSA